MPGRKFDAGSEYRYGFNGQEKSTEINNNSYTAEFWQYDAKIGRRFNLDPKPNITMSPYSTFSNNPIKFSDSRGDSINVAEKYRGQFSETLESVFGDKAYCFAYTSTGNLIYSGDVKKFSKAELSIYNQMNGVMKDKDVTNIIYESNFSVTDKDKKVIALNPGNSGGEVTATMKDIPSLTQNYIVIDPNLKSPITIYELTENYYTSKGNMPTTIDPANPPPPNFIVNTNVKITPQNATMHGLGHVIYAGKSQEKVLKFDNETRALNKTKGTNNALTPDPIPARKPDETHNKTVTKGTGNIFEKEK